jgi:hypothetical protein
LGQPLNTLRPNSRCTGNPLTLLTLLTRLTLDAHLCVP